MAVGSSLKTGADAENHVADMPTMLGQRRLLDARWNQDGDPTTADDSDALYPASAGYDGNCGTITRPASAQLVWYYIGWVPATTMDAFFLHILDLDSEGTPDCIVELLDAGYVATAIDPYHSEFFNTNKRLFEPAMQISGDSGNDHREFTAVVYIRVKFDGGIDTCRPQLTELITGDQRQLSRSPLYPYDIYDREALIQEHSSGTGIITSVTHFEGKLTLAMDHALNGAAQRGQAASLWSDIGGGGRSFVWCPNPRTAQNTAWLMISRDKKLSLPRIKPQVWSWSQQAVEQGGSLLADE